MVTYYREGNNRYLVKVGDLGLGKNIQGNEYYKSTAKPFAVKWAAPEGSFWNFTENSLLICCIVLRYSKFSVQSGNFFIKFFNFNFFHIYNSLVLYYFYSLFFFTNFNYIFTYKIY